MNRGRMLAQVLALGVAPYVLSSTAWRARCRGDDFDQDGGRHKRPEHPAGPPHQH